MSVDQLDDLLRRFGSLTRSWTAETSLATMRSDLDAFYAGYTLAPGTIIKMTDRPVPGEWVMTPDIVSGRVILLLHGGGYMLGSARAHRAYASHLSVAARASVLSIDYRLAPEHPFPLALDDTVTAYLDLLAQGIAPDNIAVCGDSAGGGLAVALLVYLRNKAAPLPACAVLVSPWADLACEGESYVANAAIDPIATREMALGMGQTYVGATGDPHDHRASPIHADLKGLPPVLILAGEREIFLDDCRTLHQRISEAGGEVSLNIWPGMIHQFALHVGVLEESRKAINIIGDFIQTYAGA